MTRLLYVSLLRLFYFPLNLVSEGDFQAFHVESYELYVSQVFQVKFRKTLIFPRFSWSCGHPVQSLLYNSPNE